MARKFTFTLRGDPAVKLEQIKAAARKGVNFQGDTKRGTFSGLISGSYRIEGHKIDVIIKSKPFFLSWGQVDSQLKSFLEN
jgi:hypothetical protein